MVQTLACIVRVIQTGLSFQGRLTEDLIYWVASDPEDEYALVTTPTRRFPPRHITLDGAAIRLGVSSIA
jgi:hypothetical protein